MVNMIDKSMLLNMNDLIDLQSMFPLVSGYNQWDNLEYDNTKSPTPGWWDTVDYNL